MNNDPVAARGGAGRLHCTVLRLCRPFGIGRTGAVQVHPVRTRGESLRNTNAVDMTRGPENGVVEGLTVEMMGGRVCTKVADGSPGGVEADVWCE